MKKFLILALCLPMLAFAEPTLHLDADAHAQVANDEMVVNLSVEREGVDSAPLTDAVLSALNDAVKDAKSVPGVSTRLGNVSTNPNWNQNKKIGWVVRGSLTLTSKDMKGLSTLTAKLSERLQLSGVFFRLSEAKRSEEEARLLKMAATNFKAKAAAATGAFGYQSYALKELTVGQSGFVTLPRPMMAMMSMKAERAPVPVEGGDTDVTVTVTGKIDLLK
jgi:predicted secreted protein